MPSISSRGLGSRSWCQFVNMAMIWCGEWGAHKFSRRRREKCPKNWYSSAAIIWEGLSKYIFDQDGSKVGENSVKCAFAVVSWHQLIIERLFYEWYCCHDFRFLLHPSSGNEAKMEEASTDKGELNEQIFTSWFIRPKINALRDQRHCIPSLKLH